MRGTQRIATALLVLAGTLSLQAQGAGSYDARFKLRLGGQVSGTKDYLDGRSLAMGFDLGTTTPMGRFSAEVGYLYKTGAGQRMDLSGMPTANGVKVDPVFSADVRKNQLDGLTLRFGYERDPKAEWTWGVGLQLNFTRFKHQYIATISDSWSAYNQPNYLNSHKDVNDPERDRPAATYIDTYNGTPVKTAMGVSPYANLSWRIDTDSSLEFGLVVLNYKALDYVHTAGTLLKPTTDTWLGTNEVYRGGHTSMDRLDVKTRFVPHLEVAYVFRF